MLLPGETIDRGFRPNLRSRTSREAAELLDELKIPSIGTPAPITNPDLSAAIWVGAATPHDEVPVIANLQITQRGVLDGPSHWYIGLDHLHLDERLMGTERQMAMARLALEAAQQGPNTLTDALRLLRLFTSAV